MTADYTIGDLLAEPGLGLELVSSNSQALSRPILGAHAIELENPSMWLEPGWMMLTMGVRLRNRPAVQRQIVEELKAIDASCLAIGVGLAFKNIPPVLLAEANRVDLPVVRVPEDTRFGEIAKAVFQSTVSIDAATFRRLSSLQQNLVRAFGDDQPLESIVRRLGRLVNAVVAVVETDGAVLVSNGPLPFRKVMEEVDRDSSMFIRQVETSGWRVLAAPIGEMRVAATKWLLFGWEHTTVSDGLARAAMQVSLPLIDAQLRVSIASRRQERAVRTSLLDALLDMTADTFDRRLLNARVSALGLEAPSGVRVVLVRPSSMGHGAGVLTAVADWLERRFEAASIPYLSSLRVGELVVVLQVDAGVDEFVAELLESRPDVRIGIGRPVSQFDQLPVSWRDSQLAVQQLPANSPTRVLAFDDLDLVTQILAEVPPDRLGPKVDELARMLKEQPIQFEALRAYFKHNRDIKAAAADIHLHPNTLRYRLERFESSLGRSLQEPAIIASVYCLLTLMPETEGQGEASGL